MNLFSLSGLLLGITASILFLIIVKYGKTKLHRIWALFNLSVAIWGFGSFLIGKASTESTVLFSWRLAHIGSFCIAIFFYHTVCIFCEISRKKIILFAYLQLLFYELINAIDLIFKTNIYISKISYIFNSLYYIEATNLLYRVEFIIWTSFVCLGHYELIKFYKITSGVRRNQTRYLFVGFFVGFLGGMTNFLPMFKIDIYPIGNFTIPLYCLIATYAILKYRLMDIKVAITRTGIFILVYTLVLGLPFALATRYKNTLIEIFGSHWWMSPLILMAFLATVGPFVYIFIQSKAEDRLLREQRRYQNTLKQASMGMTRIRNLRKLLDLIAHIVTKTVKISYAAVYLYNEQTNEYVLQVSRDKGRIPIPKLTSDNPLMSWIMVKREPMIYDEVKRKMEDTNDATYKLLEENMRLLTASVVIPSFLEDRFMGFFVLGEKNSGQIYTIDDLNVFQVLASQAALAIENAQFYEEAKEMQDQIAQAEKMATIGTMADGLSHQINNRLNALSLIAGDTIDTIKMTDTTKCSPEIKEMIDNINRALERIQVNVIQGGEVVKGILKYSRKGDAGFEPLDLNTIIDSTLEMVQFKVKLSEIDIIRDFSKDIPKIEGNLVQLQEAFFNFIDNAYDATVERRTLLKEDGYRSRITFFAQPKGNNLEIIIEDNGMGVKEENKEKVFTPFFTTKTSSHKGTGLGLYVVRRIISVTHRGKINFESGYKIGTRFILELPIAK